MSLTKAKSIKELKKAGYQTVSVKEELRKNLIEKLKKNENLFPGIIGYDKTVLPQLINAILSKHDFILLGLRGQAKTRILRSLVNLLDESIPAIKGCPLNDDPFKPACVPCQKRLAADEENLEIEWLPREARYQEE